MVEVPLASWPLPFQQGARQQAAFDHNPVKKVTFEEDLTPMKQEQYPKRPTKRDAKYFLALVKD